MNYDDDQVGIVELLKVLIAHWKLMCAGPIVAGTVALVGAHLIPPTFTAKTTIIPPMQQQNAAAAMMSQLGALAGLTGSAAAAKSPADQYVALMQSVTLSDRIIDEFQLVGLYGVKYREDARKELGNNVRVSAGKRDGLISVEVDDHDPARAAAIANAYVEGLRAITATLAVSEAQQRRMFFEGQLQQTRDRLVRAQIALQGSGVDEATLKTEPKAAAEGYARLRAEFTAAQVRLQAMQQMLSENTPELQQQRALAHALRLEVQRLERQDSATRSSNEYITRYRDFKYQETLFDLFARQYELARLDESREGSLIQVLDPALPPEKMSKPRRGLIAGIITFAATLAFAAMVLFRHFRLKQVGT